MTLKELRNNVSASSNKKILEDLQVVLNYKHISISLDLKEIVSIYKYFKNQKELWEAKQNLPNVLQDSKRHFSQLTSQIESFIKNHINWDEDNLQRQWNNLRRQLQNTNTIQNSTPVLTADSPVTNFLLEVHSSFPRSFSSAFEYLTKNNVANINNKNHLIGYLLAYEFDLQDHTEILKRRNNEKISLGLIRNKFEERLNEAEKSIQEIVNNSRSKYEEYCSKLDELEKQKEKLFDQWFSETTNSFNEFFNTSQKNAASMKELFRDGLRFAGPVKYWKERSLQMKKDGAKWMKWFTGSVILTAASIFTLLWLVPEEMTASLFNGDPAAIKWTLLFVTFISFMTYGVRTFAKLTFSSYHLARDAEEREQLTHVYLALKKDANVEEEDRLIILQSLFSRADTGLLKDDSAPTMPIAFLENLRKV